MNIPQVKNQFASDTDPLLSALSPSQRKMLLDALMADANKNVGGQEFDLSKPPVEPYRYREYPKCMYSRDGKQTINVRDEEHEKQLSKQGFQTKPPAKKSDESDAA